MTVDNNSADEATYVPDGDTGEAREGQKIKRQQSDIPFPYIPLPDVVTLVRAVQKRGHVCRIEEVAADLDQQMSSGAFRSRLSAARMFGAAEIIRGDIRLTPLGLAMCNPETEAEALAEAFLNVPLYQKLYAQYAGHKLPPGEGIEESIRRLGVPDKQVTKARQVFVRSAGTAGYFQSGRDRLVRPASSSLGTEPGGTPVSREQPRIRAEVGSMANHQLIAGLVAKLPPEGHKFTAKQRQRWLDAAKVNLELIYAADDEDEEDEKPVTEPSPNGASATVQPQPS
jgi:hypothetical protein